MLVAAAVKDNGLLEEVRLLVEVIVIIGV